MNGIIIEIDPVADSKNLSVTISDHEKQTTKILDNTYNSYERCLEAAIIYINLMKKDNE